MAVEAPPADTPAVGEATADVTVVVVTYVTTVVTVVSVV